MKVNVYSIPVFLLLQCLFSASVDGENVKKSHEATKEGDDPKKVSRVESLSFVVGEEDTYRVNIFFKHSVSVRSVKLLSSKGGNSQNDYTVDGDNLDVIYGEKFSKNIHVILKKSEVSSNVNFAFRIDYEDDKHEYTEPFVYDKKLDKLVLNRVRSSSWLAENWHWLALGIAIAILLCFFAVKKCT